MNKKKLARLLQLSLVLLLLLCPHTAWATYSLINHVAGVSTDGSSLTTSSINTTGADLIVIAMHESAGGTTSTPSDGVNTYTLCGSAFEGNFRRIKIWYSYNPTTSTTHSFSYSGSATYAGMTVTAWSGAAASPCDQTNGTTAASASSITTGSITPTEDNELVITAVAGDNAAISFTVDSGFTESDDATGNALGLVSAQAYKIQTSAAAVNPTWTPSSSSHMAAMVASFKAAGGGGGAVKPRTMTTMGVGRP